MTTRRRTYAQGTQVSIERSLREIRELVQGRGADKFAHLEATDGAMILFQIGDRRIIFRLPLPDRGDKRFTRSPAGRRKYTPERAVEAWRQACAEKWRALALVIKAKMEAVRSGIVTLEDEFLAYTMTPGGETIGDWARRELPAALQGRPLPPLLSGPSP